MTPMRTLALFETLSAPFSATGCAMTCPTIAWINSVTVALDGDVRNVAWVQLCTPDSCWQATDSPRPQMALSSPERRISMPKCMVGRCENGGPSRSNLIPEYVNLIQEHQAD